MTQSCQWRLEMTSDNAPTYPCCRQRTVGCSGWESDTRTVLGPERSTRDAVRRRQESPIFMRGEIQKDLLFLRRDRQLPLVVLPWAMYERLMQMYAA